jgi:hypothetical protein
MNWEEFKFICFSQNISQEAVDACRDFVLKENAHVFNRGTRHPESDLGYAELADITTPVQSIKELKDAIMMATVDYDARGRSLEKRNLKRFIKDPGKSFKRLVLKSYYLNGGMPI